MKVDEQATKEERKRHAEGVARLNEFFNEAFVAAYFGRNVSQDQRWLSRSKLSRRIYRRARIANDPTWAARRARRKRQRKARKVNR